MEGRSRPHRSMTVVLPTNVADGEFCFDIKGQDQQGRVSNAATSCIEIGSDSSGADVLEALQGTWYFACNEGDGESFAGSVVVSGSNATATESKYEGNTTCSGEPSADSPYTEELALAIGEETTASDGGPAFELDITNLTEGGTALCIVRVEQDRFLLGCGESSRATTLEAEFTREPAGTMR